MSVISRLAVSIVIAAIAIAVIVFLNLSAPLQTGLVILAATVATALLPAKTGNGAGSPQARPPAATAQVPSDREEGSVKWFNVSKGFGFIIRENGEEIFVHFRSIRGSGKGRRALRDGQRVSFTVVQSEKGPQAEEVEPLD